jgi:DNA-binding beta-propeller fold protein YncE
VATYNVGSNPVGLAFDGTYVYVVNEFGNNVYMFLARNGYLETSIGVGSEPVGIACDGTNMWVANAGNNTVTKFSYSNGITIGYGS